MIPYARGLLPLARSLHDNALVDFGEHCHGYTDKWHGWTLESLLAHPMGTLRAAILLLDYTGKMPRSKRDLAKLVISEFIALVPSKWEGRQGREFTDYLQAPLSLVSKKEHYNH